MLRRSQLFVPGNDEKKITKSLSKLDSDSVILDLEDAVPDDLKAAARKTVVRLIRDYCSNSNLQNKKEICVRINPMDSPHSKKDIDALKGNENIDTLVIPKAEDGSRLSGLSREAGIRLIPLIETARGLLEAANIAQVEGVVALGYGAADFANSVGGNVKAYLTNNYVKTCIAVVAKSFGIDPIDNVYFDLADLEGFRKEAFGSRDLGYTGKQVIHPTQIGIANEIFSPSREEISKALEIVGAFEKAQLQGSGAIRLNDELVDAVHYRAAKQVLDKDKIIHKLVREK